MLWSTTTYPLTTDVKMKINFPLCVLWQLRMFILNMVFKFGSKIFACCSLFPLCFSFFSLASHFLDMKFGAKKVIEACWNEVLGNDK